MKKCPVCQTENHDESLFCMSCGNRLGEPEATDTAAPVKEEAWYYVENGESKGPFTKNEFLDLIVSHTVQADTYVWTRGMKEWTHLNSTPLYLESGLDSEQEASVLESVPAADTAAAAAELEEEPQTAPLSIEPEGESVHETAEPLNSTAQNFESEHAEPRDAQEWYYAVNGRSYGPFSQSVMVGYIAQGVLNAESLVWKEDFTDWTRLADTQLYTYLPHTSAPHAAPQYSRPAPSARMNQMRTAVPERNLVVYILLSLVTCGIFELVWLYQLAESVNQLCREKGISEGPSSGAVVLLFIVTCGIYLPFFFWRAGDRLYEVSDRKLNNSTTVMSLLGFFCPIAAMAIAQFQINELVGTRPGNLR